MTRSHKGSILITFLGLTGAVLSACQSNKHTMVEPKAGAVIACTMCYDEVYKVRQAAGSRWGTTYETTHTRHGCPSCQTEVSIYVEGGVTKVKCAKCVPEGLACDKCLPPKDYGPPKLADDPATK